MVERNNGATAMTVNEMVRQLSKAYISLINKQNEHPADVAPLTGSVD